MKQREKCSGRGFDSRQVHHKVHFQIRNGSDPLPMMVSVLYNGPVMVSTGQRVTEWTAR